MPAGVQPMGAMGLDGVPWALTDSAGAPPFTLLTRSPDQLW